MTTHNDTTLAARRYLSSRDGIFGWDDLDDSPEADAIRALRVGESFHDYNAGPSVVSVERLPDEGPVLTACEAYDRGLAMREHDEAVLRGLGLRIDLDDAEIPDGILEAIRDLPEVVADSYVDGWYRRPR